MSTARETRPASLRFIPVWLWNSWGVVAAAAAVYVLLYILWTYFQWGALENSKLISGWSADENIALIADVAFLPLSIFATLACLRVTLNPKLEPRIRRAWLILGITVFSQFVADLLYFYLEVILKLPAEQLSPAITDIFYLLFYPLALWGLLTLPAAPLNRNDRARFALDLAVVMTAAWMVVWYFLISPAAAEGGSTFLGQFVTAAYPIGDLVVLGGLVALLFRKPDAATRTALLIFLAGLISFVAADLAYGYAVVLGTYASGGWIDVGYVVAYVLWGFAALRQPYTGPSTAIARGLERAFQSASTILPFGAIVLGYGLVLYVTGTASQAGSQLLGLFLGAAVLTLCVVARQIVTLRENQRLNDELRAFSGELEVRVEQRTHELRQSQEALLASQKLASVGTLAAGVVHEVSNPLNTIITASESLESQLAAEKIDQEALKLYLPIISRAAWHAARIVQALRTYSRGSAPELASQNLSEVVQDALLLMGYQLKQWRNIKLETDIDPDIPDVICDRNQIAQVLINLLGNARDAMPEGGAIHLRTRLGAQGAVIEVADEGAGIPPEGLTKIFDPFYTTKPIGEGSGLGLSIVAGIIRAHNGTIAARSDGPGKGAAFTITLPVVPAR